MNINKKIFLLLYMSLLICGAALSGCGMNKNKSSDKKELYEDGENLTEDEKYFREVLVEGFRSFLERENLTEDEKYFREVLVEDFRSFLECENNIYGGYKACLDSLEEYAEDGSQASKEAFLSAADKYKENVENNLYAHTEISEDTYGIFEKYNIPLYDYIELFNTYESIRREDYYVSFDTAVYFAENDDIKGAEIALEYGRADYKWSRAYTVYSVMDMAAESGENNIEYFRQVLKEYEYLGSEEVEWLTDRDEIYESVEDCDEEFLKVRDRYAEYINEALNRSLEENQ